LGWSGSTAVLVRPLLSCTVNSSSR
jgi:hypothetical protein